MDRKWFPDFVRVVDEFEYTQTAEDPGAQPEAGALRPPPAGRRAALLAAARRHGFIEFTAADYEALRTQFAEAEKLDLLDR